MAEPIRILHVLGNTQLGGAESRIMDLYRHLDRSRVQFDFLVHTDQKGYYDQEIDALGGRIFRVPRFRLYNYFAYKRALKDFFRKNHGFHAVQGHMTSTAAIYLPIAKKAGVPTTIAHARSAGVDQGIKGKLTRWMRRNLSQKADYLFTCSQIAAVSVFGEQAVKEGRAIFIPNAIDCKAFAYREEKRKEMRSALEVEGKYVIGHVGRFHYAKNHAYVLQVFAALCGRSGEKDYVLLLLGEGGGMEAAKRQAAELGIGNQVLFLGNRRNVNDYYQAMDFFLYPSRYEGLPGTIVEAQTAGLKCVMSDTICGEVAVTDLVRTMSIQEKPEKWADYIESAVDYKRRSYEQEMRAAGFDVNTQTKKMMDFYETGEWK